MQVYEKLKAMRRCKNWTQEEFAEKLGWAVNTYARVERGETNINLDKLKKVAEVMGVDLKVLVNSNEKMVFNFVENCTHGNTHCLVLLTETQHTHELEKSQLIIEQKDKEIEFLKREIGRLEEIVSLLKQAIKQV